jgi:hypothetical protein
MSTAEIIKQIKRLPPKEFAKVRAAVAKQSVTISITTGTIAKPAPLLRRKSFADAKRRVFSENKELLALLAK